MVDRLRTLLATRPEVETAYAFGSALRRTDARDVDVAVVLRPPSDTGAGTSAGDDLRQELRLQAHLEAALDRAVDLHAMDRLPIDVQVRVAADGELLVDRDPAARVRREIRARNLYEDFLPQLQILRRGTRERLAAHGR